MSNTFSQIYLHIVFSTKDRLNLIKDDMKPELYKYICGIINNKKQKLYRINGMKDHIHLLVSIRPDCLISDFVKDIKTGSTKYINECGLIAGKFYWQKGFGVFSVSKSQVDKVIDYIKEQEKHHEQKSFTEEFIELLEAHGIEYDKRYIFM